MTQRICFAGCDWKYNYRLVKVILKVTSKGHVGKPKWLIKSFYILAYQNW
jgi:hypothetical protein